ncbi:hypothetical protein [Neisseria sicca]|uniref:hypothetical protein n=1 Tax=Neisseria sicca TaxID=490 RepID=UPI0021C0D9F4|nr:hypothetical protein [Neisseria sicca]
MVFAYLIEFGYMCRFRCRVAKRSSENGNPLSDDPQYNEIIFASNKPFFPFFRRPL